MTPSASAFSPIVIGNTKINPAAFTSVAPMIQLRPSEVWHSRPSK